MAPEVGEHSGEFLRSLGCGAAAIEEMILRGCDDRGQDRHRTEQQQRLARLEQI